MTDYFTFKLNPEFVQIYRSLKPNWGWTDEAGNSIGELTFLRTYSRLKEDGTKETWADCCERVINGMFSIQKDHCTENRLPWNEAQAQLSAQEAFQRMFEFKWTPPGRGLSQMGTPLVMEQRNAASLQNCAFVSTSRLFEGGDPGYVFAWTTEALMLGIGVGFDTLGGPEMQNVARTPLGEAKTYVIPDTREGWAISIGKLVNSYLVGGCFGNRVEFDYSEIRPYGSPVKTFGGTASGPEPLADGHEKIRKVLDRLAEKEISGSVAITDIQNIIGTFVVAGNARRSAELALGQPHDPDFQHLKDHEKFPDRPWAFMSNNSLSVKVGEDYSPFIANTAKNGEPGYVWLDVARRYGRIVDGMDFKDGGVMGFNPCVEQPLESFEMCCLVEVHLNRAESRADFLRTLKFAYMYGKTVTLLNTPWEKTNAVMMRNRRIGLSATGIAGFVDDNGLEAFRDWANEGYNEVRDWDDIYSRWLGIRESIRSTTVKPSGSVSLLSGATPGVHWSPGGAYFDRAIRFGADDPLVPALTKAGYKIEDDVYSPNTKVVYFPLKSDHKRSEKDVSIFEKINLAAEAQHWWSDNGVSVTVSFDPKTEGEHVERVLKMYEGKLKAVSFLPMSNETYEQQPYTEMHPAEYTVRSSKLKRLDLSVLYGSGRDAEGEAYCTTDVCEVPGLATDASE